MSRQRPPLSIQKAPLFTFLDVLTCTMGLLILLLVAIARQSRIKTDEAATATQAVAQATQEDRDALEQRLVATRDSRTQQAEELARMRDALGNAEVIARRLRDELAELERARRLLEASLANNSSPAEETELARVLARIAELEASLKKARERGTGPSFAVVPYTGPNQTRRRPIYIECCSDRIVLQPEGVILTEKDFEGPQDNSNALASAVRAAEQHLGRNSQTNLRESGEPYPLLLVRPDGVHSYYVARAALKGWGSDFGYELVDGDWKLDFEAPSPELLAVETKAVEEARSRQKYLGYAGYGIGGGAFSGGPRRRGGFRGWRRRAFLAGSVPGSARRPSGTGQQLQRKWHGPADWRQPLEPIFRNHRGNVGRSQEQSYWQRLIAEQCHIAGPCDDGDRSAACIVGRWLSDGREQRRGACGSDGKRGAADRSASAGMAGGSPVGSKSSEVAVASDQQGPMILPQKMFGQNQSDNAGTPSLAESQGKNWALPDSSRGSIPVTRPINLQCLDDRLIVLPEYPGGAGRRDLPFAGRTTNAVTGLITAVWDRMDGWGIAGKGMYWRPELHVQTMPGGAQRVEELKALLKDSGIVIVERSTARMALQGNR